MTMASEGLRRFDGLGGEHAHPLFPLAELARDVGPIQEATDLRDLFAALAESVLQALQADGVFVSLLDEDRDVLVDCAASVRPPYELNSFAEEFSLCDFPATRQVIESGGSTEISVFDPFADPAERRYLRRIGARRALLSSLVVEGRGIGIVETYRVDDRGFRREDPRQVELLISFAASAYARIRLAEKLDDHYIKTIEALVSALEARDPETEAHTGRIRDLASALAVAMKLPAETRRAARFGAILHDVGKIGIPDSILRKPGPLTPEEWVEMRRHPEIGERMLRSVDFLANALPAIRHHHERWDGTGYPDGLAGEDIPIAARIVAVCDAFDAMTSDRPYRRAMSRSAAADEILAGAGTQFDPACAAILVDMVTSMGDDELEHRLVRYAG